MIPAFIETSAINYCKDNNISGKKLNTILQANNYLPVVGNYITYELARTFKQYPQTARELFYILKDLNPQFGHRHDELDEMEFKKLKTNDYNINPLIESPYLLNELSIRIEKFSKGIFDPQLHEFIDVRQRYLENYRKELWTPISIPNGKKSGRITTNIINDIANKNIPAIKSFMHIYATRCFPNLNINLSDHDINDILNTKKYLALRTGIRDQIYLDLHTENYKVTPSEHKFTDGIQVIEASYFPVFISYDKNLVEEYCKILNPDIQPINIKDLIN
jgi:hypothetical protein